MKLSEAELNFLNLFALAEEGDVVAIRVRDHCLRVWGTMTVSAVLAYDPAVVIFGGGVMKAAAVILPSVLEYVRDNTWTPLSSGVGEGDRSPLGGDRQKRRFQLNRAVAIAMYEGPEQGLCLIDDLLARDELVNYSFAHSARADLCRRLGRLQEARKSYEKALALAREESERRFLSGRLEELK